MAGRVRLAEPGTRRELADRLRPADQQVEKPPARRLGDDLERRHATI